MTNKKKILIAGVASIATLGLGMGAFAFFSDSDVQTLNAKAGSVSVDIKDAVVSHSEGRDNINPGDNDHTVSTKNRSGSDHELSFEVENTGSKSVMTRTIITVKGTAADGRPLIYEDFFKDCDEEPENHPNYDNKDNIPYVPSDDDDKIIITPFEDALNGYTNIYTLESEINTSPKEEITLPDGSVELRPVTSLDSNIAITRKGGQTYNTERALQHLKLLLTEKAVDDGVDSDDSGKYTVSYYPNMEIKRTADGYLAFVITGNTRDILNGVGDNAEIEEGITTNVLKKVFDIGMIKEVADDDILMGADLDFEVEVQAIQYRNTSQDDFDALWPNMWNTTSNPTVRPGVSAESDSSVSTNNGYIITEVDAPKGYK